MSLLILERVVIVMLCTGQDAGGISGHGKKLRDTHCKGYLRYSRRCVTKCDFLSFDGGRALFEAI